MQSGLNARIGRTSPAPRQRSSVNRRGRIGRAFGARLARWRALLTPVPNVFFVGALLVAGALLLVEQLARSMSDEPSISPERVAPVAWPTHFRDRPLTRLPTGELEDFFARRFDGPIARFTDGQHVIVLRHVVRPTRQLHPAEAGLRMMGYRIDAPRRATDDDGQRWNCFIAERAEHRIEACERIHDGGKGEWTDSPAWFWASQYGGGPWWAVTVLSPVERDH
jgi:hypothetical protein